MYIYSPLKKANMVRTDEVRKAIEKADNEDETKRDARDLMSILMRMVQTSPRLRGHILTRRTALTSFGWSIVPHEETDAERAEQARLRCGRMIAQLLRWHTDTPMFGVSATEIDWVPQPDGAKAPKVLRSVLPVELERPDRDPGTIVLYEDVIAGGKPTGKFTRKTLSSDPAESWIVDCDESYEMGGVLRALIYHEVLRQEMLLEWGNFNRKVKGIILAQYEEHAQDEDKDVALEALKSIVKNNYSLTSKDIAFSFQNLVDSIGATSFGDMISKIEDDQAIAILGQANITELPDQGGSRAAVQVQNLVRIDVHYSDIVRMEDVINDQLLLYDARLNVDATLAEAPWRFRFNISEEQDPEKNARTISELLQSGIPLRKAEVYDRVGFGEPDAGDDTFDGTPNAQPII